MKVKSFITYLVLILFSSCISKNIDDNSWKETVNPNQDIKIILDSFVVINPTFDIYELYIDKIDPETYNLIIYGGFESLTSKENDKYNQQSLQYCSVRGKLFEIYTGSEHYFKPSKEKPKYQPNSKGKSTEMIMWAVKDSSGILSTYKLDGGYPFFPLPIIINPGDLQPPILK